MMRIPSLGVIVKIFLVLSLVSSHGQAKADCVATASTDKVRIKIGDPIILTIQARGEKNDRVIFPTENIDLAPFTILSRTRDVLEDKDNEYELLKLTISAYETGDLEIPAINVTFESADGESKVVTTEPLFIRVDSVLTEVNSKPRDLKGPTSVEASLKYIIRTIGILILIIAILVIIIWQIRKRIRKRVEIIPPPPPPRPAAVVALEKLTALMSENLGDVDSLKYVYVKLTDIFKEYIGKRYGFAALERTTGELRKDLKHIQIDRELLHEILDLLELSDLVKFAKFRTTSSIAEDSIQRVIAFVEKTRDDQSQTPDPSLSTRVQL